MRISKGPGKKKLDGPTMYVRMSQVQHKELCHLAEKYTLGNLSEVFRQLLREEMSREILRRDS